MGGSPVQVVLNVETNEGLSFPKAMEKLVAGEKVARKAWSNGDYCFMGRVQDTAGKMLESEWLGIKNDKGLHIWQVNDGDLLAEDWYVVGAQPSFATG